MLLRAGILVGFEESSFVAMLFRTDFLIGNLVNHNTPHPLFFVSVATKGFSLFVSLLFAILMRSSISIASKGFSDDL
jgi:hypothetical protein